MKKIKYLHGNTYKKRELIKFKRNRVDFFHTILPKHQKMRSLYYWNKIDIGPLENFLYSKVGKNWNDIYSEILTKFKKNQRYNIHIFIGWFVDVSPIYDDNYVPRSDRGNILEERLFVDLNNILCYKTKYEILEDSKKMSIKISRELKLKQLLENIDKELPDSLDSE